MWGSSSLPHPVLLFQSTSSSASDPVYLIQCCSSSLPHPVQQFQSTSSSALVPVYLIQCCSSKSTSFMISAQVPSYLIHCSSSSLQFQSTSSSLQFQSTLSSAPISVYLIQYSSPDNFNFSLISCIFVHFFSFKFLVLNFFYSNIHHYVFNVIIYYFIFYLLYTILLLYNIHYCHSDFLCFRLYTIFVALLFI